MYGGEEHLLLLISFGQDTIFFPITWRVPEESNPIRLFSRTWFSRPVAGPSPLHQHPYLDRPEELESPTSWFVAKCSNPFELRTDNFLVPSTGLEPAHLSAQRPQRCVSTNSTMKANTTGYAFYSALLTELPLH